MARGRRRATRPGPGRGGRRGRRAAGVTVLVVLALVAGGAAAYRAGALDSWLPVERPPALTAPVPGFRPPTVTRPVPVARPAPSPRPPARALRRALGAALRDPRLARLRAVVAPLTGPPVLDVGSGPSMPASTLKLLTMTAVLEVLGPARTFATRVVSTGRRRVVLVGGGDPFLTAARATSGPDRADASLQALASLTARRLRARGVTAVRLGYDAGLFSGPSVDPHWPATYVPEGVVTPITALWADEGRILGGTGRVADPPASAAATFAAYLRRDGIRVGPGVAATRVASHARPVALVRSPPVADIVEQVLQNSDNEGAEVLAHQLGLAVEGTGSFAAGVHAVRTTLGRLGIRLRHATIQDGSGLSRHDRVHVETLVQVLQLASSPAHPELRSLLTGLPVAAYDGSLSGRFDGSPGRGIVRAKTGTLTGTDALAGITTDALGHALVFAFVSNHVNSAGTLDARAALDRLASSLATCRC